VRFAPSGERFAAVGEGGVVATWRLDAPTRQVPTSSILAHSNNTSFIAGVGWSFAICLHTPILYCLSIN
jgi:hypothetical protein